MNNVLYTSEKFMAILNSFFLHQRRESASIWTYISELCRGYNLQISLCQYPCYQFYYQTKTMENLSNNYIVYNGKIRIINFLLFLFTKFVSQDEARSQSSFKKISNALGAIYSSPFHLKVCALLITAHICPIQS